MATLTANQASDRIPATKHSFSGLLHNAYGVLALTANPTAADLLNMCKVPAGALVMSGEFWCSDMDTNGTPTLDIDFGWPSNGGGVETITLADGTTWTNAGGTAAPSGFINSGVLSGAAVTSQPEIAVGTANYRRFNTFITGPKYFSRETTIQGVVNVASATFAAGSIYLRAQYIVLG